MQEIEILYPFKKIIFENILVGHLKVVALKVEVPMLQPIPAYRIICP